MKDIELQQPSGVRLLKLCGWMIVCSFVLTMIICGTDVLFQFVIRFISGVI